MLAPALVRLKLTENFFYTASVFNIRVKLCFMNANFLKPSIYLFKKPGLHTQQGLQA